VWQDAVKPGAAVDVCRALLAQARVAAKLSGRRIAVMDISGNIFWFMEIIHCVRVVLYCNK
jgi:hypothetical protein